MTDIEVFETKADAANAVASLIGKALRGAAKDRQPVGFAAAGGSTPEAVYEILSCDPTVPWEHVAVTLTDERRAPESAGADNASMIRRALIKGPGRFATFSPLTGPDSLNDFPDRFGAVLLGMGKDGHFASIFPKGEGVDDALAVDAERIMPVTPDPLPSEAPYSRWTLSLDALCEADVVVLFITGDEKRAVLDLALGGTPDGDLPIRALLRRSSIPLHVMWAP